MNSQIDPRLQERRQTIARVFKFTVSDLELRVMMPSPKLYAEEKDELSKKHAESLVKVGLSKDFREKNKEEADMTADEKKQKQEDDAKLVAENPDLLGYQIDLKQLQLRLFEKGLLDGWTLNDLTQEEYDELTKGIADFFEKTRKNGGIGTQPGQIGETASRNSQAA